MFNLIQILYHMWLWYQPRYHYQNLSYINFILMLHTHSHTLWMNLCYSIFNKHSAITKPWKIYRNYFDVYFPSIFPLFHSNFIALFFACQWITPWPFLSVLFISNSYQCVSATYFFLILAAGWLSYITYTSYKATY